MKYDWNKLHREFITGDYKTLKEFAEKKNMSYKTLKEKAKGWVEEKQTKDRLKSDRITKATIDNQVFTASEINKKHLSLYASATTVIEKLIKQSVSGNKVNVYNIEKAVDSLQKIQKGQRLALGMDRDGGNQAAEEAVARVFGDMRRAFAEDEPTST